MEQSRPRGKMEFSPSSRFVELFPMRGISQASLRKPKKLDVVLSSLEETGRFLKAVKMGICREE